MEVRTVAVKLFSGGGATILLGGRAAREFHSSPPSNSKLPVQYVQGQSPEPRIREYFYYVDHHGQLFLDDARMKNFTSCFKDKEFLAFFFKRLRRNNLNRYADSFPYLSLCGRERNFVRCDDLPIVYTDVITEVGDGKEGSSSQQFSFCNGGKLLCVPFHPEKLCMLANGRVYYPAGEHYGGIGLVRSGLAIEFSKLFRFEYGKEGETPPTHFLWNGQLVTLTNELVNIVSGVEQKVPDKHVM